MCIFHIRERMYIAARAHQNDLTQMARHITEDTMHAHQNDAHTYTGGKNTESRTSSDTVRLWRLLLQRGLGGRGR